MTDLPVGPALPDWSAAARPERVTLEGRFCRLEPLNADQHSAALFDAFRRSEDDAIWTYLGYGPFESADELERWHRSFCSGDDPLFFAIVDASNGAIVGQGSYLRIHPEAGSIEVGHLCYSPLLQRSAASTEAMYLLMRYAFSLGYRRYEWKCDALNAASRRAAERLGFSYEGTFRQALVYKGRNRDTAWYSILDGEWPALQANFERWLDPQNFDADGRQLTSLQARG